MKKLIIILILGLIACSKQAIEPPRVIFIINTTIGTTETEFVLDASKSTGENLQFKVDWEFGFTDYSESPIFKYKYSKIGEFLVTLRIKDFRRWTDDYKQLIKVKL